MSALIANKNSDLFLNEIGQWATGEEKTAFQEVLLSKINNIYIENWLKFYSPLGIKYLSGNKLIIENQIIQQIGTIDGFVQILEFTSSVSQAEKLSVQVKIQTIGEVVEI